MSHTILVVDDQWSLRKLVSVTLTNCGYKVIEAVDGLHALEALSEHKADLMLTDWSMPEMDGQELIVEVRRRSNIANLPVIVLSCHKESECHDLDINSLGIVSWLHKPFRMSTLRNLVMKTLSSG